MSARAEETSERISFELAQDEDGYPPDKWERLWANSVQGNLYRIDNIPFYVKGISSGDVVVAMPMEEELIFHRLVKPSLNSVIRLFVFQVADVPSAREAFRDLGCESELSNIQRLFAIEIPESVHFDPIGRLIEEGVDQGRWEFEIGVLRHDAEGKLGVERP